MKILVGCLLFGSFTGSEMYVYELSKKLIKLGCDVTVTSPNLGSKLVNLANANGIKVVHLNDLRKEDKFDVIHCQHYPIVEYLCNVYPDTKKVCSIHSEVINLENPYKHKSIRKYVAIRPEIQNHIIKNFNIDKNIIDVIYNPIDEDRFKSKDVKQYNATLFVGTVDYLRKNTLFDLADYTKSNGKLLWIVGDNKDNYLNQLLSYENVKHSSSVETVEEYFQRCSETAGILLGRTTIEGWLCGKSGWIYDVDSQGNIKQKTYHNPPSDVEKFHSINVAKKIKEIYENI
jgi:glycosyltransferase involved in cell wall biosynthesis